MQYEIKRESKINQIAKKTCSSFEDYLLTVALFLAKIFHSNKLNMWIANYTQEQIKKAQQDIIRMRWKKVALDKATASINERQSNS